MSNNEYVAADYIIEVKDNTNSANPFTVMKSDFTRSYTQSELSVLKYENVFY
jgi:hypothetical protein